MFIDVFQRLCREKGVSPSRALLDLDMGKSSVTRWKNGGEPSNSTKKMIADYFGVTVSELTSGESEQKETPVQQKADEGTKTKNDLTILARHLDYIPEEIRDRLVKNFSDTVDTYLDAMGIDREAK